MTTNTLGGWNYFAGQIIEKGFLEGNFEGREIGNIEEQMWHVGWPDNGRGLEDG